MNLIKIRTYIKKFNRKTNRSVKLIKIENNMIYMKEYNKIFNQIDYNNCDLDMFLHIMQLNNIKC